MADTAAFHEWSAYLGLHAQVGRNAGAEVLELRADPASTPRAVITRDGETGWSVVHEYRIPRSVLDAHWRGVDGSETASVNLATAARELVLGFPLVQQDIRAVHDDLVVILRAPLCAEGLAAQGFLLTVSAVLKAAEAFDLVDGRKAEEVRAWHEFRALSVKRSAEQRALIDNALKTPTGASGAGAVSMESSFRSATAPAQTTVRFPSHARGAAVDRAGPTYSVPVGGMYAWATPDATQQHTATLPAGTPIHVIERWGDWAHVLTDNGWSGWVDGRPLHTPPPG